jgi:hypothetical protein
MMGRKLIDRANDLLKRADKLGGAVSNLEVFRRLLADLDARTAPPLPALELSTRHARAIRGVRAAVLRSAIGLTVAILDTHGRDRASLGQVVKIIGDAALIDFLVEARGQNERAGTMREKLRHVCNRYPEVRGRAAFRRVRQLRHNEIGHLLIEATRTSERSDLFELADETKQLVGALHEGLGMEPPPYLSWGDQAAQDAKLFWDTYLAGVAAA